MSSWDPTPLPKTTPVQPSQAQLAQKYLDMRLSTDEKDLEITLDKIRRLDTRDILIWVDAIVPGWILHQTKSYTREYAMLEQNWIHLCNQWKTKPKYILIVEYIPDQRLMHRFQILSALCNHLTRDGNVIRKESELTTCVDCDRAMLTERVVEQIHRARQQHRNEVTGPTPVPEVWNERCADCLSKK